MTTLNQYLQRVQRFLRDGNQQLVNPADLVDYINRARQEVALRTQCIRRLTPICGQITGVSVTAGGSGYSAATVTFSDPDFPSGATPHPNGDQATGTAVIVSGAINDVEVSYGGEGYFQPTVSITGDGTGATASVSTMTFINKLTQGREQYLFSDIDLSMFPGVESVYMIKSISVIYSNYRYSLPMYAFSVYQAQVRQYPLLYQWTPAFATQFAQGTEGSFFVYPLPSQDLQVEYDCFCLPSDLTTNLSVEAIPEPWTSCVSYYAAHLAYLEIANFNAAALYGKMFDDKTLRYSAAVRPGRVVNPYGRY